MEIQQTYRMLKYQEALYKKELDIKKKELQEISTEKAKHYNKENSWRIILLCTTT